MGDDRAALNEALDESNRAACFGTGERAAAARARVHAEVDRLVEEAVTTEGRKWRRGLDEALNSGDGSYRP